MRFGLGVFFYGVSLSITHGIRVDLEVQSWILPVGLWTFIDDSYSIIRRK